MSRMKLNVIAVSVVLLLTSGFAMFFFVPGLRKLKEQRDLVKIESEQTRAEQQRLGNISALYQSIVELDKTMSGARERLPQQRNFGEFLNAVSESLKKSHIEDFTVQPKPPVELDAAKLPAALAIAKGTIILPVRITFEGTLAQLVDFQGRIEKLPRLSHVESLKLTNDESHPGVVQVEFLLLTFSHPS